MILVLAGTSEGRRTASCLARTGFETLATTVSEYGAQLLRENGVQDVRVGHLERDTLTLLLEKNDIQIVVDATHPFAVNISNMAMEVCLEMGVLYIRLERPGSKVPDHPLVFKASTLDEALEQALAPGGVLFSALGSRNLSRVVEIANKNKVRVIARVLPDPDVLSACLNLGLTPSQLIAAQGPFSRSLNRELFRAYGATAVITKESGGSGGVDSKISAALDLGIPAVVWMRPRLDYPVLVNSPEEATAEVKQRLT